MAGETGWGQFLWEYGSAVWEHWYTLIPGLALSILDLIERWLDKALTVSISWLIAILVVSLLVAQILASRTLFVTQAADYNGLKKSYDDLAAKHKTLEDQTNGLHGQFGTVQLLSEPRTRTAIILANIAVTNTGNPTVAQGFVLQVNYNGTVHPASGFYHPEYAPPVGLLMVDKRGQPEMRLTGEDLIFEKTRTPIPSGGYVNGWALYRLDDVKADDLNEGVMSVDLTFHDVYGNMYHTTRILKHNPGVELPGGFFLPGSAGPFERTPRVPKGAILVPAEPRKRK